MLRRRFTAYKGVGNVDFSTIGEPGDHINDYALSLTGVFLHELHHSLCDASKILAMKTARHMLLTAIIISKPSMSPSDHP